ncbi:MAG: hypothetical protein JXR78_14915, partial [Victivallales bacterium]|nr:hypothetical protein [Victivallales bacterium]
VAAYGAWLLLDSGNPAYSPNHLPDHQKKYIHYFDELGIGNTFMANCLAVDGLQQDFPVEKVAGPTSGWETPIKNLLHFSDNYDLTEGTYDGWYKSEPPITDSNMSLLINNHGIDEVSEIITYNSKLKREGSQKLHAKHRRLAIFLREQKYWVLIDEVEGGREYIQTWNFPPIDKGLNTERYFLAPSDEDLYYGKYHSNGFTPSQIRFDEKNKRIITISHYRPNIAIMNFVSTPVRYSQHYGNKFPFKGWQSYGIVGENVPAVQMEGSWRGSAPMITVLYPMKTRPGNAKNINAGIETFENASNNTISSFTHHDKKILTMCQASRAPANLKQGNIKAKATLLLTQKYGEDIVKGVVLGCENFSINGKPAHINNKNFEFSLNNGKISIHNIVPPETFRWKLNNNSQMIPEYK